MIKNIVLVLIIVFIVVLFVISHNDKAALQPQPNTNNIAEKTSLYEPATDMEVGLDDFSCICEAEYEYEFADQEEDIFGNNFGYGCQYKDECEYEQHKDECQCSLIEYKRNNEFF